LIVEGSVPRRVIGWVLWPSSALRWITVPGLEEETYDWRLAVTSAFFGTVMFVGIAFPHNFAGVPSPFTHNDSALGLWIVALAVGLLLAAGAYFVVPRDGPPKGLLLTVYTLFAFLTSVLWIIIIANEVVAATVALGFIIGVSSTILGLTVIAWGDSLGDLVADVSIAKEGFPKMALAACFAGPAFNLLMGLGLSLVVGTLKAPNRTLDVHHDAYSVYLTFGALLTSLVASITIVPLDKFRIRPWYGACLIVLYIAFLAWSIAKAV
jgi:sodium/potassium/calcium exchanger 6